MLCTACCLFWRHIFWPHFFTVIACALCEAGPLGVIRHHDLALLSKSILKRLVERIFWSKIGVAHHVQLELPLQLGAPHEPLQQQKARLAFIRYNIQETAAAEVRNLRAARSDVVRAEIVLYRGIVA